MLQSARHRQSTARAWLQARAQPRCDGVGQMLGGCLGKIVERNQALAETITTPPPCKDQCHRGRGDRAIIMADEALEDARLAAAAARTGRSRNSFLVGAAKEKRHQSRLVEQASSGQRLDQRRVALIIRGDLAAWQRCANGIGDIADEALQHRVISARSCSVRRSCGLRKKSRRTVARRPPRRGREPPFPSAAGAAMGHSSGIMRPR